MWLLYVVNDKNVCGFLLQNKNAAVLKVTRENIEN